MMKLCYEKGWFDDSAVQQKQHVFEDMCIDETVDQAVPNCPTNRKLLTEAMSGENAHHHAIKNLQEKYTEDKKITSQIFQYPKQINSSK